MTAYTRTTINGIDAKLWDHSDTSPVRRLASDLGRGCEVVKELETDVRDDAMVKVEAGERFHAPDGWSVESVFSGSNGKTYVDLVEQEVDA